MAKHVKFDFFEGQEVGLHTKPGKVFKVKSIGTLQRMLLLSDETGTESWYGSGLAFPIATDTVQG